MADEHAKTGTGDGQAEQAEQITPPVEQNDAKKPRSLDQMDEGMFQKPAVKKLLGLAKVMGNYGHKNEHPDNLKGAELVEAVKVSLMSYKKFSHLVEALLNDILDGTTTEEEMTLTESKLIEGVMYWIYFRTDMGFGKEGDSDHHLAETQQVVETLLQNNILGDDREQVVLRLIHACLPGESTNFIQGFVDRYVQEKTKQKIQETEQNAKADFDAQFRDPVTGKYSQTIRPGAPTPPKGTPAQKTPSQPAAPSAPAENAEPDISRVTLSMCRWHMDEDYDDRVYTKITRDGDEYDPVLIPGKKIEMVDEDDDTKVNAAVEIVGNKVMIVSKGSDPIIDLDSGLVIHALVVQPGKPARIQLDEDKFEINIEGIERAAGEPAQAQSGTGEPAADSHDSHPTIEAGETEAYNLPAVMCVNKQGDVLSTYVCLGESDRVVSIGTDPSCDIVLPQGKNYKPLEAEVKFINGKVFVNAGKDSFIRTANSVPNAFISSRAVLFDQDDTIIIGGKDVEPVYFKATAEQPFSDLDVKGSLAQRVEKLSARLAAASDIQAVKDVERQISDLNATLTSLEDKLEVIDLINAAAELLGTAFRVKEERMEKESRELEAKMATRRHYSEADGETAETPRPFKYAVLIDKVYRDPKGGLMIRPVFPPGVSMGTDKVNTFEAHLPRTERGSKYGVQDFECTFVIDGSNVRMVLEPRLLKNSKIHVNGQIPGTRDGKTNELDMLRAPLRDGDDIEVGLDRLGFETGHEFTLNALKPYAAAYLREIMEVLVLYPNRGDDGDKKNARATLEHFLSAGIVTQAEVDAQRATFEQEKFVRETTDMAGLTMTGIRGQNNDLARYIEDEMEIAGLPYDVAKFRAALELLEETDVRWEETNWSPDEYRRELGTSAVLRLQAYDKKLLELRTRLQQGNYGKRITSFFSRDAEKEYTQEQESLHRALRKMLVEMVTLIQMGVTGDNFNHNWMASRLSQDQAQEAEEIFFAQRVVGQIHEGANFSDEEVKQLLEAVKGKTYGDYLDYLEVPFETPMADFILAKVKARAKALFAEAGDGENIGTNLSRLEALISAGLTTYEDMHSSHDQFRELRDMEEYFIKQKAGHAALAVLVSAAEPSLEDIVDFADRLKDEEFTLSDEKDGEFRAYCRVALQGAVEKARIGQMRGYFAVMASSLVRLRFVRPRDIGTTMEELEGFHDVDQQSTAVKEMLALREEITASGMHNIHPLLKLKAFIEANDEAALVHDGESARQILAGLVGDRMQAMVDHVKQGGDPGFMEMIVGDMQQFGLEKMIEAYVEKTLDTAIEDLFEERKTVEQIRPTLEALRLLKLGEVIAMVQTSVTTKYVGNSFDNPSPDIEQRITRLGENLRALGLYEAVSD